MEPESILRVKLREYVRRAQENDVKIDEEISHKFRLTKKEVHTALKELLR